ncbi:uncharacterized protein LOC133887103 isoform X2 [Phragmites australis]|uniref:uncharacterized protein LOC133887103 isoform X2 n=1 Tax=Phragmites australis TaxID=29695 RepID=UPI002D792F9A|nr:uncharacterized protein LOC133887103 isoform X2 [Phragmites australis]
MDAVAFPPPPAPFVGEDFDFGDFTFASAPAPQPPRADPTPAAFAAFDDDWGDFVASPLGSNPDASAPPAPPTATSTVSSSWEKPRGPLPLSLFGADDEGEDGQEEEGPAGPPPTATAHQRAPSFGSTGSRPADLKDLIAGLYGSQPPSAAVTAEAEDDDGFGDDGWEFKAATAASPAGLNGVGLAHGDGIGKIEDITESLGSDQEDWSSFTSVDEKLNHVQTTDLKASSYPPANNAAILKLYRESELADDIHIMQSSAESVQSFSDLFSNNEMNSSFETDENHSIRSTSDSMLIQLYHRLREESLSLISRHVKDLRKRSTLSDENRKAIAIGREIQEIYQKLQDSSFPKGSCTEEHPSSDVYITELLNSIKEEHLKDFEQEYRLAEKIALAMEDTSVAVELYKHSVSTLHTLELASKEEQCAYVGAWYSMLQSCAQELQHGAALWRQSCHANVCDQVVSEGTNIFRSGHCFIALGEIYIVSQILYFSLRCFKPWVLAEPEMLSKMLASLDSCNNSWTSGLERALKMVVDSNHINASVAKALIESIKCINELVVPNLQNVLPNGEMTCRLTFLPTSLVPGLKLIMWNGDHYFVKVANLWANRISSDPPLLSQTSVSSVNNEATLAPHVE